MDRLQEDEARLNQDAYAGVDKDEPCEAYAYRDRRRCQRCILAQIKTSTHLFTRKPEQK